MQFILRIYNRLCSLYSNKKQDDNSDSSNDNLNIIFSVDIDDNYNRHFSIYIPDYIDPEKVLELSEAYTETLLDIGSLKIVQQLIQSLELAIDKKDPIQKLFFDNVVSLFVEHSSIKRDISEPMIQPLSVFNK
jgi:hypothetical protein